MSYNGSGTFQINTSGQPVVTGTAISSTVFNALTADLATGLSTAITKDGQTTTTARIPFALGINSSLVTDASSTTTGSIITAGGVGIAKALYVGTTANIAGDTTLSGGTANGVAYLNGSKVLTTGSALVFDGTNLGVGVTPSGWSAGYVGFQVKNASLASYTSGAFTWVGSNWYNNSGNKYIGTGFATLYEQTDGKHAWLTAASGTAGNAITFTQAMTLDASGLLALGTTSPAAATRLTLDYPGFVQMLLRSSGTDRISLYGDASVSAVDGKANPLAFYAGSAERARIDTSGNFRLGNTAGGTRRMQVESASANFTIGAYNTNGTPYGFYAEYSTSPNNTAGQFFQAVDSTATKMEVRSNGGIANYSANNVNLSDRREKINFAPAGSYLDKICAIPVQTFNYIDQNLEEDAGLTLGVVAQDVQAVAPELVMESNWAKEGDAPKMRLSIYQTDLQYALMKCIQEQQALITTLTARITALESA